MKNVTNFHIQGYSVKYYSKERQRKPKEQSIIDNPETLATVGTQDTGRRSNQEQIIQINWQHKTQDENKQIKHTTEKTKSNEQHRPHQQLMPNPVARER